MNSQIAGQAGDLHRRKGLGQTVEQGRARRRVGVAPAWQKRPDQRDAGAVPFDRNHQEVDAGAAEVPIGPVDGKRPGLALKPKQACDDARGDGTVKRHMLEEAVEAALHRGKLGPARHMGRQLQQADTALPHDQQHQPGQRLAP